MSWTLRSKRYFLYQKELLGSDLPISCGGEMVFSSVWKLEQNQEKTMNLIFSLPNLSDLQVYHVGIGKSQRKNGGVGKGKDLSIFQ